MVALSFGKAVLGETETAIGMRKGAEAGTGVLALEVPSCYYDLWF